MSNSEKNEIDKLFKNYIIHCFFFTLFICLIFMITLFYPFKEIPDKFTEVVWPLFTLLFLCTLGCVVFAFSLKKKIKQIGKKNLLIKKLGSVIRKEEKAFHNTDYTVNTSENGTWIEFEDAPSVEEVKQILKLEFPKVPHMAFYIRLIDNKIVVVDYNVSLKESKTT